jgi:hypothetical protein
MSQEERDEGKPGPIDLEANSSAEPSKAQNLDHEYSIPATIKFAWLGTYFVFSLALTLHNKLVLGSVSLFPHHPAVSDIPVRARHQLPTKHTLELPPSA